MDTASFSRTKQNLSCYVLTLQSMCISMMLGCRPDVNVSALYLTGRPTELVASSADPYFDMIRTIAAEFRVLPRPLVRRYRFHPELHVRLSTPTPGAYIPRVLPAANEPILNIEVERFIARHDPAELEAAL